MERRPVCDGPAVFQGPAGPLGSSGCPPCSGSPVAARTASSTSRAPGRRRSTGRSPPQKSPKASDAWRITSYGFIHDTEHALLAPFAENSAMEVSFTLDFSAQFDQAGIFVREDRTAWVKAGIEWSDGEESPGSVVTRGVSDRSLSPVPGWNGKLVTVRASRAGDALTIRARVDSESWRLVRVAPLPQGAVLSADPFCCAPTRDGLTVRFTFWQIVPADTSLHPGN